MNKLTHRYRFFWKNIDSKKFNKVTVSVSGLEYAHLGMYSHIVSKLKKSVEQVAVDHLFYEVKEDGTVGEMYSLNDREHELQVHFKNQTWPVGAKPV